MAQCPECTYEIPAGAPVCTTCGAPVKQVSGSSPTETTEKGVDEWLLRGIIGFLVVVVLAAAAFTVYSLYSQVSRGG